MNLLMWIVLALAAAALGVVVAGQVGAFAGQPPSGLGLREGNKLKPPSRTPNSVSSQADLWPDAGQNSYARIAPLAAAGDRAATMARLRQVVQGMAGARVEETRDDYLRATFRTRLMGYVDDAEFWFDPAANAVQVRSASRVGGKDYGVNRERVEAIRGRMAQP